MPITELINTENTTSRTYVFEGEGHTLGNALRSVISRYPDVVFCGYTVPHPSENKINFRIQTSGPPAIEILQRGFQDLEQHCTHINEVFKGQVAKFKESQTFESWKRLIHFHRTYRTKERPQYGYFWSRIINSGYMKEYTPKENLTLSICSSINNSSNYHQVKQFGKALFNKLNPTIIGGQGSHQALALLAQCGPHMEEEEIAQEAEFGGLFD